MSSLCRMFPRNAARVLSLRTACTEGSRRFYSANAAQLEEKHSKALLGGGQQRIDKQHASVSWRV